MAIEVVVQRLDSVNRGCDVAATTASLSPASSSGPSLTALNAVAAISPLTERPISHHRDEEDGSGLPHTRRRILTGGPTRRSKHSSAAPAPRAGHHDLSACPTSDACWYKLT
jgi:hypothetical protein